MTTMSSMQCADPILLSSQPRLPLPMAELSSRPHCQPRCRPTPAAVRCWNLS